MLNYTFMNFIFLYIKYKKIQIKVLKNILKVYIVSIVI